MGRQGTRKRRPSEGTASPASAQGFRCRRRTELGYFYYKRKLLSFIKTNLLYLSDTVFNKSLKYILECFVFPDIRTGNGEKPTGK